MRVRYCVLILMICACQCQRTHLEDFIGLYRLIREVGLNLIGRTSAEEGKLLQDAKDQQRVQPQVSPEVPFPCDVTDGRSPNPPDSVHKVRPGDVDVIGAMGDSLTAGYGALATQLVHVLIENRGVSWSGGGQRTWREYLTLPNIIKEFNPNLIGYALSDSFSVNKDSQFNVAEGGAMSRDTPYMAKVLVARMKHDPRVDLKNHWKLINLMIGPNDFCTDMCYLSSPWLTLKLHRSDLIQVLRTLRDNLPRTIVSLVLPPNLKVLVELTGKSALCEVLHDIECSCMFGYRWRSQREEFYKIMEMWQNLEIEVAMIPEFQTNDFAVVVQPFTMNITFPSLPNGLSDRTYLSTDCFHLSQKCFAKAANSLWNNILEPVGQKQDFWDVTDKKFLCPTPERPYIATLGNR